MKVLILSVSDKRHMSMVAPYEEYLKSRVIPYDIIRINRYVKTNKVMENHDGLAEIIEFPYVQSTNKKKIHKVLPFLRFRKFALRIIKQRKYDFIIVWNENTAILFSDLLLRSKNNYCINIRDLLEYPMAKRIKNKLISNSLFCTIPSPARAFGCDEKLLTLYNRDTRILNNVKKKSCFKKRGETLNIVFLGLYASAPETFKKTADVLGNDDRYMLYFCGDGFDTELRAYVNDKAINNVCVEGAFAYEKTYNYLTKADVINSYYNNFQTNPNLSYVSGVKQSYSPMLYIPAINDDNTTWAEISKKFGFSYLVNDGNIDNLRDDLYDWYCGLKFDEFKKKCDEFNEIIEESRQAVFRLMDKQLVCNNAEEKTK